MSLAQSPGRRVVAMTPLLIASYTTVKQGDRDVKVNLKQIKGPWAQGWVLDKHTLSSTFTGENEFGHPTFHTIRSEVGEASYQLKYRGDVSMVAPLAEVLAEHIFSKLTDVGFILPMPASTARKVQPVTLVATELGKLVKRPVFDGILLKRQNGISLKDLHGKEEKLEAIGDRFHVEDQIESAGAWNVLLVDDLYDTGASMEKACQALQTYPKVKGIYVAALTWK